MSDHSAHQENNPGSAPEKKRKWGWIAAAAAGVFALAFGVYGTLSYFTDKVTVGTVFTFGNVEIIPNEPSYPPENPPDTPNEETPKNPLIANNGTEVCIVFMEVKVPVATFTLVNEDGTKGEEVTTEVFWLKANGGADNTNSFNDINNNGNWVPLSTVKGTADGEYTSYLFGYRIPLEGTEDRVGNVLDPSEEELAKLDKTHSLFDKAQIKNYLEGTLSGSYSIIVNSYGIQAEYLSDGNDGYIFGDEGVPTLLTEEQLKLIWQLYSDQMA